MRDDKVKKEHIVGDWQMYLSPYFANENSPKYQTDYFRGFLVNHQIRKRQFHPVDVLIRDVFGRL